MTEREPIPTSSQEGFGFTENERLFDRVSDERFRAFIFSENTIIHRAIISSNNYGEFIFITASCPKEGKRECITFWGYGLHEYRERWLTKEWFWHRANQFPETMRQQLSSEGVEELLQARLEEIAPYVGETTQSKRAQLFEMLADMGDEDGAYCEMEDLGALFDDYDV